MALSIAATLLATQPGHAFDVELPLEEGDRLVVEVPRASLEVVEIENGAAPRVRARAAGLGASEVDFEIQRRDGVLHLVVRESAWIRHLASPPLIEIRATVPAHCEVELAEHASPRSVAQRGF